MQSGRQTFEFSYLEWSARSEVQVSPGTTVLEAPVPPRTGGVHGKVLRAPAPPPTGASVALAGPCVAIATTDATGVYWFPALPSGDYEIRAPLSVTQIENCEPGGPQASVSLTASAVFGQVSEAPDLVIP